MKGALAPERSPLEKLARARALQVQRHSNQLQIWFGSAQRQYPVTVFGVYPADRALIVSAPTGADGGLLAVMRDQTMGCRWSSPVAVYTFRAMVSELVYRPQPVLHAGQINSVVRFTRRQLPRVATALPATLHAAELTEPALLTDLSVAGAQVALAGDRRLEAGQQVQLGVRLRLMERDRTLKLDCTVVADRGETDPEHPLVHFYGVHFEEPDELTSLVLLGCVQHLMLQQADQLGRLLQANAVEAAARD
jgi:c-di-GMP-binding flagellar brake protein YcgR